MGLSWNLGSQRQYQVGTGLEVALELSVLEAGAYYLLGALYTSDGGYIPGTAFGIIVPAGSSYGVLSDTGTELWTLGAGESVTLPCRLVLGRTGVILGLFLMKMAGESASLQYDTEVAQVSTVLTALSPLAPVEVMVQTAFVAVLLAGFAAVVTKEVL